MPLLIGMDEAGHGPNLGPFVVAATVWEVPAPAKDFDFWTAFESVLTRAPSSCDPRLHVADSKQRERLERALQRARMGMVMGQEVEKIAQELPEQKQHHEIGTGDQAEQDEERQADEGQVPRFVRILVHVVDGIGVDDRADARDQYHHDGAEPVDVEADRKGE